MKTPISERALLTRLNRKLKADGIIIRRNRSDTAAFKEFGRWCAIDLKTNAVTAGNFELEDWGRKHGVLKEFEELRLD
ncbi:hypothetical protein [Zobellella iuensis]|uniref:Uncharacterized protein n=1 Tax=Zobellella iuensis TaxID=2803811 RepID=A0ABS1QN36_9GAMM|nr:hypothetical protein [Zobellella iuensis]MBL1376272.1 hypothetical protein [Zobellella iuensis]